MGRNFIYNVSIRQKMPSHWEREKEQKREEWI